MKDLITAIDRLPKILKLILCIPALDIVWAIYRIMKGVVKNDALLIVVGILWIAPGVVFAWLFDLVTVLLFDHPKLTDKIL